MHRTWRVSYRSLEAGAQPGTGLSVRRPRLLSLSLYYICLFGKGAYRLLGRNFLFQASTTCLGSTFGTVAFYGVMYFLFLEQANGLHTSSSGLKFETVASLHWDRRERSWYLDSSLFIILSTSDSRACILSFRVMQLECFSVERVRVARSLRQLKRRGKCARKCWLHVTAARRLRPSVRARAESAPSDASCAICVTAIFVCK